MAPPSCGRFAKLVASTKVQLARTVRASAAAALVRALKFTVIIVVSPVWVPGSGYVLVLYITTTPMQMQPFNPFFFLVRCKPQGDRSRCGSDHGTQVVVRDGNSACTRRAGRRLAQGREPPATPGSHRLRQHTGRDAGLESAAGNPRDADAAGGVRGTGAAVNAVAITMDGLTTAAKGTRFARAPVTRTVAHVSDDEDAQLMLAYGRGEIGAF